MILFIQIQTATAWYDTFVSYAFFHDAHEQDECEFDDTLGQRVKADAHLYTLGSAKTSRECARLNLLCGHTACVCVFTTTVSCIRFNFQALFDFCSLWDPVSDFGVLLLLLFLLL